MLRSLVPVFLTVALGLSQEARGAVDTPKLLVKDGGRSVSLELTKLSVSVEFEGLYAETIFELEYFNHTKRRQEGEFILQLPPGATVSTYALEVNGNMRPAVSVEKDKARNAYESIKRRNIDPGLVERERNNTYRTRIFPIEPGKPKRVRIGFIDRVGADGYSLPLKTDLLKEFSCSVKGTVSSASLESEGLSQANRDDGNWNWTGEDLNLDGDLKVSSTAPTVDKPIVRVDRRKNGTSHFVVQGPIEEVRTFKPGEDWKQIRLIWDTSYSGRFRDHEAELDALDEVWKWVGDCEVSLQLVGYNKVVSKPFVIRGGDGSHLRERLSKVTYDGGINYQLIEASTNPTLIVSDGTISSPAWQPDDAAFDRTFLLKATPHQIDNSILAAGILPVELSHENWIKLLKFNQGLVAIEGIDRADTEVRVEAGFFSVSGHFPPGSEQPVQVTPLGGKAIEIVPTDYPDNALKWNLSRRIWAQARLASFERSRGREEITRFSKEERLASDFTSLIVLELFSDHLRYQIPPPEPELLKKYNASLYEQKQTTYQQTVSAWNRKIAWHDTEFPWVDAELQAETALVSVWVESSHQAFPEAKRNHEALRPFEDWLERSAALTLIRDKLNTGGEFLSWKSQIEALVEDLNELRNPPPSELGEDPIHVSVRGFVDERGIYSKVQPFNLSDAVDAAGGPNSFGSRSRVYLYRNAQRTGYNLESEDAFPVPLRWGDMIVVEAPPQPSFLSGDVFADPFFASESPSFGSRGGGPVFEETGSPLTTPASQSRPTPFGGKRQNGNNSLEGDVQLVVGPGVRTSRKLNTRVIEKLKSSENPRKLYGELLGNEFGTFPTSISTTIEIARFFFEIDEAEFATAILSTLCELHDSPIEGARAYAYWLAELGQQDAAIKHLNQVRMLPNRPLTRALIDTDVGRLSDKPEYFRLALGAALESDQSDEISTIAATDYFGRVVEPGVGKFNPIRDFEPHRLPSDLRIVITSIGDSVSIEVTEPPVPLPPVVVETGSIEHASSRVSEFQIRRAWPGVYGTKLLRWDLEQGAATVHIQIYRNWGTDDEEVTTRTILMPETGIELGEIDFNWKE